MRNIDLGEELKEKVSYSNNYLIAYHRASLDAAMGIAEEGFRPGGGAMYGKGFYLTYDLASQTRTEMTHYGNTLLKCRINPKNLLIFDYNISKAIFGDTYTLKDQLIDHYKIFYSIIDIPKNLFKWSKELERSFDEPTYSADVAYNSFVYHYVKNGICTIKGIRGIIFTGNHDGNVLVSYAYDTAIPFEYASTDNSGQVVDIDEDGRTLPDGGWVPVKNIGKAETRADKAEMMLNKFKGTVLAIDVENYDLNNFEKDFPWFMKAKVKDALITITDTGEFIWNSGTWISGEWYGDLWELGDWKKGKWHKGNFQGGYWYFGNFLGGEFSGGNWLDGVWTDGIFRSPFADWRTGEIKTDKGIYKTSSQPPINESVKIDSIIDGLYNLEHPNRLNESFQYYDLTPQERDDLYANFRDSYQKAVGASWDQDKFESRAGAWTFFGSKQGGIAARKQRSGMYKLVATFGSPKTIINAFTEMEQEAGKDPIWGVMTQNLAIMLEKRSNGEFKQPPKLFVKTLIPHIKNIFGDVIHSVEKDGGIVVDTPAGLMTKYFIANKAYFSYMLDQMENRADTLPIPALVVKVLVKILRKFI